MKKTTKKKITSKKPKAKMAAPQPSTIAFETLEPQEVFSRLGDHFLENFGLHCSFLIPIEGSGPNIPYTLFSKLMQNPGDESNVTWIETLFAPLIRNRWDEIVFRHSKTDGVCALVPVIDPRNKEVIGYVATSGLTLDRMKDVKNTIVEEIRKTGLHLAFVYDFVQVQNKIFIDDVTVLYNQRYLPMVLENEISRAQRMQTKFSVLFIDIDYFKSVNDTRGHLVGSRILQQMGQVLKKMIRPYDYAFRYGGDEFVLLLTEADIQTAQIVAERVRKTIEAYDFVVDEMTLKVTISIGVAVFPDHAQSADKILKLADQAMYYAKHKSRNYVFVAS